MILRQAIFTDISQLINLRKKMLVEEGLYVETNIDNELLRYFENGMEKQELLMWVAEEGNKIIATCGVCFYQLPPSFKNPTGRNAYIVNVYTEPQYRKQGIATKLLEMTLQGVRQRGFKIVRLHASEEGKSVYKKMGFTDSKGYMFIKI